MITLRLPDKIEKRLSALAKRTGRTKTSIVRNVILEFLEDLEDYGIAEHRMRRIRSGKEKTFTLEEVKKHLGLEI